MDLRRRSQTPPNSASTTDTKRTRLFLPLSNHGMPRTPLPKSPGGSVRSHRFAMGSPTSPPLSGGSPPLSARTFSTVYGSEPSLSPRTPSHLSNGSTLVSSSPGVTPSLPPAPTFDNIDAIHAHRRNRNMPTSPIAEQDQPSTTNPPPDSIEPPAPTTAEEDDGSTCSPLHKLAHRIRTILASRQSAEKRAENRRRSREAEEDFARVEQVHWTEM